MFRAVPLPIIRSYPLYIWHWHKLYRFDDSLRAGSGWNPPDPARKLSSNLYKLVPVPNVQWITPDDGQRNCLKHVEFVPE
jgi:hypothetical protein